MWCDGIEALLRLRRQRDYESKLARESQHHYAAILLARDTLFWEGGTHVHKSDCRGEADAQVVPVRLFHGEDGPGQEQEDAAYDAGD
jgi:hypothetical protein